MTASEQSELRIVSVSMENVEGLPKASYRLGKPKPGEGQFHLLEGENGTGKSSFIHGLFALSSAAHDPRIVRDGAERSVIELVYVDHNGEAAKVTRTIDRVQKHPLEVETEGIPPKQLETWIKQQMGVGFGQNPLDFLVPNGKKADAAKRKERLEYLMRVLDISFPINELKLHTNGAERYLDVKDQPKQTVLDIQAVNKLIRDFVTIRGPLVTKRDTHAAAAERDRKILVTDEDSDGKDWPKEMTSLEARNRASVKEEADAVDLIQRQLRSKRDELQKKLTASEDAMFQAWNKIVEEARAGRVNNADEWIDIAGKVKAVADASAVIARAETAAAAAVQEQRQKFNDQRTEIASLLATAKAKWEEGIRLRTIKENMDSELAKAAETTAIWEQVDAAVKAIEALKKLKLSTMPPSLNGLTIGDDDDIYIEGRPLDKWNRGEQYIWAMRIASIGTGNFNLIVCDEGEHLDDKNLELVRKAVVKSGLIVFMARRTAGPLHSIPEGALELQ